MSRLVRIAFVAVALSTVAAPVAAFAEPDPPRPVCELHHRDRTISNNLGLPDITYPEFYWVC